MGGRQAVIAAVALAGVVLALLWPEERGTAAGRARAVLFALLAAAVGFALAGRQADSAGAATTSRAFQAYTEGLGAARGALSTEWLATQTPSSSSANPRGATGRRAKQLAVLRDRALRSYAEAVRLAPASRRFRREYAILLADAGRREAALRVLSDPPLSPPLPGPEAALWQRLYGPAPPRPAALPALEARLRALRLGWYEALALRPVYRRLGLTRQAEKVTATVGRQAFVQESALIGLTLLGIGVMLLGLVLWWLARRHWRAGRLRPVPAAFHAGLAPLLEAFVLYLFLSVAPALLPGSLRPPAAAGRSIGVTLLLLFGVDLLVLAALVYLWARLRGLGLGLAEIGLHARQWSQNVRVGLTGYTMALPLVVGSGMLAGWLGKRFFPEIAPPFHPIEALTLNSPSAWVRLALLIAVAILAPLLEEIFFRGMLYGALRRRFGVAVGVVGSAAVFSLLHPQLPLGFLPIFILGAAMALLYEGRQSLVPGIVLHAVNNGLVWILLNLLLPPSG